MAKCKKGYPIDMLTKFSVHPRKWDHLWKSPCVVTPTGLKVFTYWGRDKMTAIFQTTYSNALLWMKMCELRLIFHWSLLLKAQLTIFQHWFRYWLGAGQATSHCLNQWCLIYCRIWAYLGLNALIKLHQLFLCDHRSVTIKMDAELCLAAVGAIQLCIKIQ